MKKRNDHDSTNRGTGCQTLPGLPRAARPSGRFAEGKTPQRGVLVATFGRNIWSQHFGHNVRQGTGRRAHRHALASYPTCCPLARPLLILSHRDIAENAARDRPWAHGMVHGNLARHSLARYRETATHSNVKQPRPS